MTLKFRLATDSDLATEWITLPPGPRRVQLNATGVELARFVRSEPRTLSEVFDFVRRPGVEDSITRDDALAFLHEMSRLGALERLRTPSRSPFDASWRSIQTMPLTLGAWFDYGLLGIERGTGRLVGVFLLTLKSQIILVGAAVLMAFWVGVLPILYGAEDVRVLALQSVVILLSFTCFHLALIGLHEYSHWKLAERLTGDALLLRRGMTISVLYPSTTAQNTALVSAAGPLVAALVAAVICAGLMWFNSGSGFSAVRNLGLGVGLLGLLHLFALLPWVGDGRALFAALRELKLNL